ncbi:NitT/TauT family transport system permease protein [Anaerotaenia torta]|uniref:ABC transporter permease n=1 Tax=Anaerotaenia torta TaxID=433293 RepID=UPI003D228DC6
MKAPMSFRESARGIGRKLFVLCFWLLVWELISRRIGNEILLAAPAAVFTTLLELIRGLDFWRSILSSSLRIIAGFSMALAAGTLLAVVSYRCRLLEDLVSPLMRIIKAMPVASFIILALVWIKSRNLSVLISFMMVVPMIYSSVLQGLRNADEKLLQMARVFRLGLVKKAAAIYIPSVKPFFMTAITVGLGFCWKAGIAAEVIGIPSGSIGKKLYEAKLYLMTKELLAWTVVIILISIIFEKAVVLLFRSERRQ